MQPLNLNDDLLQYSILVAHLEKEMQNTIGVPAKLIEKNTSMHITYKLGVKTSVLQNLNTAMHNDFLEIIKK